MLLSKYYSVVYNETEIGTSDPRTRQVPNNSDQDLSKPCPHERCSPLAPPSKQKKNVSFNEQAFMRETLHISDYNFEEKRNSWFNRIEMHNMKAAMAATLRLMVRGDLDSDSNHHCARGLEFRSRAGARKRKENNLLALEAVLGEQDNQYDKGIFNQTTISRVYHDVSRQSRISAYERGMKDEVAANEERSLITPKQPALRMMFGETAKKKTRLFRLLLSKNPPKAQ
jgi:hypothetical protein